MHTKLRSAEYRNQIAKFMEELVWGTTRREIWAHLKTEIIKPNRGAFGYILAKYRHVDRWGDIRKSLLQRAYGDSLSSSCGMKNVRKTIYDTSYLYSNNEEQAWRRIFHEANSAFNSLLEAKVITPFCGFKIIKNIYEKGPRKYRAVFKDMNKKDIRNHEKVRFSKLKKLGLITDINEIWELTDICKNAYEYSIYNKEDIENWERYIPFYGGVSIRK